MPYAQRFGLNRLSPLNMTEKEEKEPATSIIENNNLPVSKPPPSLDAERLNDPNYGKEDGVFTKIKTVLNNPMHSIKSLINPGADGYRDLTTVRKGIEAAEKGNEQAKDNYASTELQNTALSFLPPVMAAQTVADAASGDLMGAFIGKYTKKFKKLKDPIKKAVTGLYYGSKAVKRF
jgi:hypothetical protein